MIRLFISPASAERLAAAREFVLAFPKSTEMLVVGASCEAADHLVRAVASGLPATFGLHRFSLTQLAARLATAELARHGLAHSTALGAEAVAARATFEALAEGRLRHFSSVARLPGFARSLAATIGESRAAGLPAGAFRGLPGPGADLAELLERFEDQLAAGAVADRTALFEAATRSVPARGPDAEGSFARLPVLLLDVPLESAIESAFVEALVAAAPQVLATVPAGDAHTRSAWKLLPVDEVVETPEVTDGSGLSRLNRRLFSDARVEKHSPDSTVVLFSTPGEARECVEIARRVLAEQRAGRRFDEIAILLRDPGTYSSLIEASLTRAGIPAYFARGARRPDPTGRAFLALLACACERLSAKRFAEYLSLGQVPELSGEGSPPSDRPRWVLPREEALSAAGEAAAAVVESAEAPPSPAEDSSSGPPDSDESPSMAGTLRAPWRWEELLVEAAVIGGRDRWVRRLRGLEAELRGKREEKIREEGPEAAGAARLERELKELGHLQRFALPIIEVLAALPPTASWGEWLESLQALAPRVLSHPQRVLGLLAELRPMAEIGPVTLDEVRDVLAERLSTLEPDPPRYHYGRVFVGRPQEARGRTFAVVLVPGLAEHIFPRRPREDPLLLDELREELNSAGEPPGGRSLRRLRTQGERIEEERALLRLAVGAATERIYFSYPRLQVTQARQRVPSFYALDVVRATTGSLPNFEELERDAAATSGSRLAWPAPTDASAAIDNMEHDLAVLGRLLHSSPADAHGRARYLMELNEHLGRSLRTRWMRWHKGQWSSYDGLYHPSDPARDALARSRLGARPYSVSALQKFAVCPYQFLLSAIHRLEPREEPVPLEQMDALTRGKIFHSVQADLMRRLRESGGLPVLPQNLGVALQKLDEVLQSIAAEERDNLAPAIERVWNDSIDAMHTDLRAWLQYVAETPDREGWEPVRFEYGFGFRPEPGRDPESRPEPVVLGERFKLHGWVDMIERRSTASGQTELRVTDHKTGQNRTQEGMVISGGEILQPVLYSLAVEAALGHPVVEGRLFYCTSVGGFTVRPVRMHEVSRDRGLRVLEIVDRAIEAGTLLPAPRKGACTWCDFREVCGPDEERRAERKDAATLEELTTLRALP